MKRSGHPICTDRFQGISIPVCLSAMTLEKLHVVEDVNGQIKEPEKTKREKDILKALNEIS